MKILITAIDRIGDVEFRHTVSVHPDESLGRAHARAVIGLRDILQRNRKIIKSAKINQKTACG